MKLRVEWGKHGLHSENLVKIVQADPEIICLKGLFIIFKMWGCTPMTLFIYTRVIGLMFTKFTHNIGTLSQLNIFKSEWRYCNPFRNARATNKGE